MHRRDFLASLLIAPLMSGEIASEPPLPTSIHLPFWSGQCVCTAYCPCPLCCGPFANGLTSLGQVPMQGSTVAGDPGFFPYGTVLYIEGLGTRVVSDCGGAILGTRLDIFFDDHNDALAFGRRKLRVRVWQK